MSRHLPPETLIDAAEREAPATLSPVDRAHLERCDRCAALVRETRAALDAARTVSTVPEPSPLYWEHLTARVREATVAEPVPAGRWWSGRAWVPLLAGAVAVALTVTLSLGRGPSESGARAGQAPEVADGWEDVLASASSLSRDDVQTLAPWAATPVSMVADLTPEERDVFASLLEREMAVQEP